MTVAEVGIVGGGIVGLATARALAEPGTSVLVLEAESDLATHQTGHNSGVVHSGLYYRPGSSKARTCRNGREALYRYCEEQGIRYERCGKLVVATSPAELFALRSLERRGAENGLGGLRRLSPEEAREIEPEVAAVEALHVPDAGVVDFREVAHALADDVRRSGGSIETGFALRGAHRRGDDIVLTGQGREARCRELVACAGLQADRIARLCGVDPGLRIVPFRGEYLELAPGRSSLVRGLIYPVPDTRLPFLGVHLTRRIDGRVEAGPGAILALARDAYRRSRISTADVADVVSYLGFWRMAFRFWRTALVELRRSLSHRAFARAVARLVPAIRPADLRPGGAGIRAQAIEPDGTLVDDFRIVEGDLGIHVLNAPSPAATAALAIGEEVAARVRRRLDVRC